VGSAGGVKMLKKLNVRNELERRNIYFALCVIASVPAFWVPMKQLVEFIASHDYASYILLVAPVSIFLVYLKRQRIFSPRVCSTRKKTMIAGPGLFLLGLILLLISKYQPLSTKKLSLEILSLVILWMSIFVFCYGRESFMKARFPLLFLLLLVPIPEFVIDKFVFALQAGSSDVAYGLLRILNVPVLKDGFILRLPMVNLEVAKECSGIRSSMALLVTVLVAAEFVLRSSWKKLLLLMATIPILVLKNGVRIVTIYLLAAYVNPAFLHGWLHTSGGVVFYLLGLVVLIPVTVLLRRGESKGLNHSSMHELAPVTSV
jgi:exosortase